MAAKSGAHCLGTMPSKLDVLLAAKSGTLCLDFCSHRTSNFLTATQWEAYVTMFGEAGMEVYETSVWIECETSEGNKLNSLTLRLRERMEQLHQKMYTIQEAMEEMRIEETIQSVTMEEWVNHVEETLNTLVRVPNREVVL